MVWLRHFRKFDMNKKEHRAKLIDSFVNVIYLYDDHLDIFLNYKDGAATVVFDDVMLAQAKERKKSIPSGSDLSSLGVPEYLSKEVHYYCNGLLFIYGVKY